MAIDINKDNSITISNFQEGISQSPLSGFYDMMGINLEQPGVASTNTKFELFQTADTSRDIQTFTANTTSNELTVADNVRFKDQLIARPFRVSTTGTLPTGLSADTIYYAATDTSGKTFKVATSTKNIQDASYVDITSTGSGTHTVSFITMGKVIDWTYNSYGDIMALTTDIDDDDIFVWQINYSGDFPILVAGNTQSSRAKGIINYKGYTIVFRGNDVDALLDQSSWFFDEPSWTNNFDTFNMGIGGSYIKPFYSMREDAIFFYAGEETRRYYKIGLLTEDTGQTFDPANTDTFSMVEEATTIPFENNDAHPTTISELGEYLVIGTYGNKIYFWDKKSPSFTSFIEIKHSKIISIKVIGNTAYCITEEGFIYVTNTTTAQLITNIPEHLKPFDNTNFTNIYTRITAVEEYKNRILMGVNINDLNDKISTYIFELDTNNGRLTKYGITSLGEGLTTNTNTEISSIFVDRFATYGDIISVSTQYYNDAEDTIEYLLDNNFRNYSYTAGSRRFITYDNYEAYIITELFSYGDVYNKKTLRNIGVNLMRPLTTGQGIKLSYRRNDNSDWTEWKTIDFTNYGAVKEIKVEAPLTDIKDLQVKISLSGYNGSSISSPEMTTPYLKSIRLIP